jgi:hypothetical protein
MKWNFIISSSLTFKSILEPSQYNPCWSWMDLLSDRNPAPSRKSPLRFTAPCWASLGMSWESSLAQLWGAKKNSPFDSSLVTFAHLSWNPIRVKWMDQKGILEYTMQQGKQLLRAKRASLDLVASCWHLILPPNFQFTWEEVWDNERKQGSHAHLAALAQSRCCYRMVGKFFAWINKLCTMCNKSVEEFVLHKFWSYNTAQKLWVYSIL